MKKIGYTFIELLAVVIILSIIARVATPLIIGVIDDFKDNGYFVYAADMDGTNYKQVNYSDKVLLVIGSEGNGLGRLVKKNCDEILSIPQFGHVNSLNASVAAAILIYGIVNK